MLTQGAIFLEWKITTWVSSISLLTVVVVYLHIQAEQSTYLDTHKDIDHNEQQC